MSEASVDTRIVEAKFDSAQFEKGVDKTVKKLDELKQSLKLEDTGKSVADMTDKASKSLKQLEDRFTSFAGMIKQKLLSGIADEIVGVFFKIKNSFESLVSSLSIGQIGTGKSKYEQMLTSVRTMIAAGDNENAAYEAIEKLGVYSDQTSYSLDQMTSALSKMRAAGVDLGTGTKAVQGIANACAAAGVNATDAARAFYNLSQSYSSGYLRYTDYRSLELLNMTTISFKEQMLEAMEAAGTLKKVSDGVYQTINKNDKKVVANKKVTVKNLTDSLKYNIMNTEAMNKLFGEKFFFGEEEWRKYKTNYNTVAEAAELAKKDFNEVAVDAYLAAREARSFTDVLNTLKDVISTGWANSFELIFGRLGEATDFFTWLTENNLAEAIYAISEFRNLVLGTWNDSGGRESLMAALENIDNFLGRIFEKLGLITMSEDNQDAFEKMFGQSATEAGEDLYQYTLYFERFTEKMDAWLTDERATRIATILSTIGKVVSTFFRALGMALKFAISLFDTFEPVLGAVIDGIAKIVDKVNGMFNMNDAKDGLDSIQFGLDNILNVAGKLVRPLTDIVNFLSEVALFIVDLTAGTVVSNLEFLSDTLGFFIELFGGKSAQQAANGTGVIDGIKKDVIELGNACKEMFGFVKDFFHNLYEDLRLVFGLREAEEGEEGGFFSNLANFFKTNEFITKISDWVKEVPNKIAQLGKDLWNTIDEFLFGKKVVITKPSGKNNVTSYRIKTGFSKFLDQAVKDVKKWFDTTLPNKVKEIWNKIDEFFFGKKVSAEQLSNQYGANVTKSSTRIKEGFSAWLDQAVKDVKDWIKNMPEKVTELWNTVIDAIFYRDPNPKEVNPETGKEYGPNERVKTGFLVWLEALPGKLWGWISNDLPKILKNVWDTVVGWIFGPTMKEIALIDPTIKQEKDYEPNKRVGTAFSKWLESIPGNVYNWITIDLPKILYDIWETVLDWIFGPTMAEVAKYDPEIRKSKDYEPNKRVGTTFSNWLKTIPENVMTWIGDIGSTISDIWKTILDAIFGTSQDELEKVENEKEFSEDEWARLMGIDPSGYAATQYARSFKNKSNPILKAAEDLVNALGIDIVGIIKTLPALVLDGLTGNIQMFSELVDHIGNWFAGENDKKDTALVENVADTFKEEAKEASPILRALTDFGAAIKNLIIVVIPNAIKEAFIWVQTHATSAWEELAKIFTGEEPSTAIGKSIQDFGNNIIKALQDLPHYIRVGLAHVKLLLRRKPVSEELKEEFDKAFKNNDFRLYQHQSNPFNNDAVDLSKDISKEVKKMQYNFNTGKMELVEGIEKEADGFNLWDTLSDIGSAIVDVFAELGPYIIQGFNKILEWIGKGLKWITGVFNNKSKDESITDAVTKTIAGDNSVDGQQKSALIESLTNIGETIKDLITTIIPEFVKSGIKVASEELPKLFSNLFGGDTADQISENVSDSMTDSMQKVVKPGQQKNATFTDMILGMFVSSASADEVVDTMEVTEKGMQDIVEANKSMADEMKELDAQGKWNNASNSPPNTIMGILGTVVNGASAFANSDLGKVSIIILGISAILSSLSQVLQLSDELSNAAKLAKWEAIKAAVMGIVGIFAYIAIAGMTGDEKQIENAQNLFDKMISLLDKVSTLLIVLASLKTGRSIADMVGNIFGKVNEAGGVKNAFVEGIGNNIGNLIKGLLVTFGIAEGGDILTTGAENWMKNLAGVFQSAELGFSDLLTAIENLASINDKFDAASEALGKVGDLFEQLYHIFDYDTLLSVDEVVAGENGKPLGAFESYIRNAQGELEQVWMYIDGDEVKRVDELSGDMKKYNYTTRSFVGEFMDIIKMFNKLSGSIALFKEAITTDNTKNTSGVTTALSDIINMKDSMKDFAEFATSKEFEDFKAALMSIGGVFQFYSLADVKDFNKPLEDWRIENAVGLLQQVFGNHQLQDLITTLSKDEIGDTSELMSNAESISIFAGALILIAKACADITDDTGGNIKKLIDMMAEISPSSNGDDISTLSSQFGELGNALASFAENTQDLTDTNLGTVERALDAVLNLAKGLKDIPNDSVLAKVFTGDRTIDNFALGIAALGDKLKEFFNSIQNVDTSGFSKDYNRNNLELALMAVNSLVHSSMILGKASYINDNFKNASSWLSTVLGDLSGLGTSIMGFIKEIVKYEDLTVNDVNFEYLNNVFDSVNKIIEIVLSVYSNYTDLRKRIENVGEMLFGKDDDNTYNGVMGYLNRFFAEILKITQREDVSIDLAKVSESLSAYSSMVENIVLLIREVNGLEGDNIGANISANPMEHLVPAFTTINTNYDVFTEFLNNAKTFDKDGLAMAKDFFAALHDLASGLYIFSQENDIGEYKVLEGLSNLIGFNWSGLEQIKNNITDVFGSLAFGNDEDFTSPKITPVLEITDDFISKANQIRSMLGYSEISLDNKNGEYDINNETSLDLAKSINIPTPIDYTNSLNEINSRLDTVNNSIRYMNNDLTRMAFVINGKEFAATVGPDIDEYLGEYSITLERVSGTS